MSRRGKIIILVGGILLALRCFFPIEERAVYKNGIKRIVTTKRVAKRINVSKTVFQCLGIAVTTGLVFVTLEIGKKERNQGQA